MEAARAERKIQLQLTLKRGFDITFSLAGLVLCAPLFVVIAAAVKLDSEGPVFYAQDRYTCHKERFNILKFRTMVPNAEPHGAQLAVSRDGRVTRVGGFLRRFKLDELPQLVNILRGEMSFVGPRPERPFYADVYSRTVAQYDRRYAVRAGLTGLAQLRGNYNTKPEDKLVYDCLYIDRFSLGLDLLLMLQTPAVVLTQGLAEHPGWSAVPQRQRL